MFAVLVLALVASASANVYIDSKCPDVKVVENFDLASYGKGIWYEVARYPNSAEKNTNCGIAEYTLEGDVFKVKNSFVADKKKVFIEGFGKLADGAGNTGKLLFTLHYGISGKKIENVLKVLSTDYENYAIGYFCKYDEERKSRQDFAWILSRTKTLSAEIKTITENFVKESIVLDSSKFIWSDFSDENCNVKA